MSMPPDCYLGAADAFNFIANTCDSCNILPFHHSQEEMWEVCIYGFGIFTASTLLAAVAEAKAAWDKEKDNEIRK